MNWLSYFFLAFILSLAINGVLIYFFRKRKKTKLARLGGIGIITTFLISTLANSELQMTLQLQGLIIGSILILVFGLWDDFRSFSWKPQLVFQLLLVLILIISGFSVFYITGLGGEMIRTDLGLFEVAGKSFSFLSIFLIALWVVAIINAVGWSDGVDGLAGGIALLGGAALFLISLKPEVNQPAVAILSIIFLGAVLGFWLFNLPFAKIHAGTSGSYFIGFFLAAMAIIAGTKIATAMIVLAIPLVDFIWVIVERKKVGWPITKKDKRHLHYKLRRLGWNDGVIVMSYMVFIFLMLLFSWALQERGLRIGLLGLEIALVITSLYYVSKRDKLLKRNFSK